MLTYTFRGTTRTEPMARPCRRQRAAMFFDIPGSGNAGRCISVQKRPPHPPLRGDLSPKGRGGDGARWCHIAFSLGVVGRRRKRPQKTAPPERRREVQARENPGSGRRARQHDRRQGLSVLLFHVLVPLEQFDLHAELGDDPRHVVLDLSGVTFMDSTALGVIVGARKAVDAVARQLAVAGAPEPVARLFSITQVDQMVPMYDDVVAALESAGSIS